MTAGPSLNGSALDLSERLRRPFPPGELEWRVQRSGVSKGQQGEPVVWATLVPYITSRAVMERLDGVFGPLGWEVRYVPWTTGANGVVAELRIRNPDSGEWVTKQDGGEQPKEQGEQPMSVKGGFSNALKRAAVTLGIGRGLYGIGDIFAEISLEKRKGWQRAQAKGKGAAQGQKVDFWWRVPEAGIRLACGLGPNDAVDDRTPPARPSQGNGLAPTRAQATTRPAADTGAAGQPPRATDAPTPRQIEYLSQLMHASVFTDDERLVAREEMPSLTKATLAARIDQVKRELEKRKALLPKPEPGVLAGVKEQTSHSTDSGDDNDDDLPF